MRRHPRFEIVGEAGTADEALAKAMVHKPDVVVMDIRLPGRSGIDATRDIVAVLPETKVIILTSFADDDLLMDAVAAGATGYVLKQIGSDDLVRALEAVGRGEALLDPAMMNKAFARLREAARRDRGDAFKMLTEQEVKITRARRPRSHQSRGRRRAVPLREDGPKLRLLDPGEARPVTSRPGCRLRRRARSAGCRRATSVKPGLRLAV